MLPGFCLGIVPNTGDSFSYTILPVKDYKDIPTRRPVTLVCSFVRNRDMTSCDPPLVIESTTSLAFYNADGEELFSEEEMEEDITDDNMSISSAVSADSLAVPLPGSVQFSQLDMDVFLIEEELELEPMETEETPISANPTALPTSAPQD